MQKQSSKCLAVIKNILIKKEKLDGNIDNKPLFNELKNQVKDSEILRDTSKTVN